MIIVKVPLRISFVGGGTDFHSFFKNHPSKIIACSINKYLYVSINEKFSEDVKKGIMPFKENKAKPLLKKVIKNKKLFISSDYNSLKSAKYIIITIGTPINIHNEPNAKEFLNVIMPEKEI